MTPEPEYYSYQDSTEDASNYKNYLVDEDEDDDSAEEFALTDDFEEDDGAFAWTAEPPTPHDPDAPRFRDRREARPSFFGGNVDSAGKKVPDAPFPPSGRFHVPLPSADNRTAWVKNARGGWEHLRRKHHTHVGEDREFKAASARHQGKGVSPKEGVRYMDAARRARYEVALGSVIIRKRTGIALDTTEVFQHYKARRRAQVAAGSVGKRDPGFLTKGDLGVPTANLPEVWRNGALIWVCAPHPDTGRPTFYTHVCKAFRFHHSSFNAGAAVIGAGEWVVRNGRLLAVNANSGHYQPDLHSFTHALLNMTGAFNADTQILVWDKQAGAYAHVPSSQFVRDPTGGGRYVSHKLQA